MGAPVVVYPIPTEEDLKRKEAERESKEEEPLRVDEVWEQYEEDKEKKKRGLPYVELKIMFMPSQLFIQKMLRAISYFTSSNKYDTEYEDE